MDEQEKFNTENEVENQPTVELPKEPVEESAPKADETAAKVESFLFQQKEEAQAQKEDEYKQSNYYQQNSTYYSSQNTGGYDASKEPGYSPYSAQSGYNYTVNQSQANNEPKKDSKKKGKTLICIVLAVIFVFCGVLGTFIAFKGKKSGTTTNNEGDAELLISDSAVAEVDDSDGLSAQEIYTKNYKSNVGVILYGSTSSLFSMGGSSSSSSSVAGEGSGIVMGTNDDKTKTYIITCAHVIESAKTDGYKVVVQDYNGEQYDAEVVGYDSKTDIGVISVEETGFTAATFGDSSALKIGETVYAIGNPGGTEFFGSYTKGMVSAIERPVSNEIGYDMKCIQHDAAINPGNSGGMLINSAGQVVGINSSKIASTEYEGMGFSIPISSAKTIIDDIIANGYVTDRPKLGISYAQVSQYQTYAMIAHYNDLPAGSLIIAEIADESAFNGTDAKEGDLIIAVDGEEMETADVLLDKIENGKVGDKLKLTLCRIDEKTYDVEKFNVVVTLIEDKGTDTTEEATTQSYEDYFNQFFGGSSGGFGY